MREQEVIALLARGELEVPPLEIVLATETERLASGRRVDWFLDISWRGRLRQYAVEYKSRGTPRYLAAARAQIEGLAGELPDTLPMVMAPYLSEKKLNEFADYEVSAIDLCGNAFVVDPGQWFVYRTGFPNLYPEKTSIKNIYTGTSGLVCRALLERGRFQRLSEVQEYVENAGGSVSLGTVSKVVTVLRDELVVAKRDGIEVIQAPMLLSRLAANYRARGSLRRLRGSFSGQGELLREAGTWADRTGALVAVSGVQRYARAPTSDAYPPMYTNRPDEFAREFGFEEGARFANAEIRGADDPQVFFDLNRIEGTPWQSEIQTYLELMQGDKRSRDLAALLRDDILARAV